jgi:hypothetical protein
MPGMMPEAWIGQEVVVQTTGYSEPVSGTLVGLDDKGIAIRQSVVGGPRPVFIPGESWGGYTQLSQTT